MTTSHSDALMLSAFFGGHSTPKGKHHSSIDAAKETVREDYQRESYSRALREADRGGTDKDGGECRKRKRKLAVARLLQGLDLHVTQSVRTDEDVV
jgi:hypothetical protein